jgi:hypothetical protein
MDVIGDSREGHNGHTDTRWRVTADVECVVSPDCLWIGIRCDGTTEIGGGVVTRIVGGGDCHTEPVARRKDKARLPQLHRHGIDCAGRHFLRGLLESIAVLHVHNGVLNENRVLVVRIRIRHLHRKVGVRRVGRYVQVRDEATQHGHGLCEHLSLKHQHIGTALNLTLVKWTALREGGGKRGDRNVDMSEM